MEQFTREQLEAMGTAELLKLHNRLITTPAKPVKRFESRKIGITKLLRLIAERAAVEASLPKGTVRTVSKMGASKAGRPTLEFSVAACQDGKSDVRESSLRGQIMVHIRSQPESKASISQLESKFGTEKTRGAVQKLIAVGWLKRAA